MAKKQNETKQETKQEVKTMTLSILGSVNLAKDLTKYTEKKDSNIIYKKGEIITNVHIGYKSRFEKYPELIEIAFS